ncbi:MAG: hypothetical protein CMP91_10520 [Gammaproteobacteria bacterium]|nr:hypothetical protein [Gammaproteobacteria bacterium]
MYFYYQAIKDENILYPVNHGVFYFTGLFRPAKTEPGIATQHVLIKTARYSPDMAWRRPEC